jgi:hypothetical protein
MAAGRERALLGFIAAGLAGGSATVSHAAAPYLINGSGATLQAAWLRAPASTNDFIDVDANGVSTGTDPFNSQLAAFDSLPPFANYWQLTYRFTGSGNGFAELRDWGLPGVFATAIDGDGANGTLQSGTAGDGAIWNRADFVTAGVLGGVGNASNPGGTPVRSLDDGTFRVTTSTVAPAGIHIDFASLDVPVSWFVTQTSGTPKLNAVPGAPGYGDNPRTSVNKDGTAAGQGNKLKNLVGLNGAVNVNTVAPNANTVFDTPVLLAPVAAPVNMGVGLQEVLMSDLRHGFATGRRMNGENLMFVTRDSGSGTRNAFSNGICLDPSWCVGENIGPKSDSSATDRLGPDFQPSNKGGSSRVDGTTTNHRLAIGQTGAERGESNGWLVNDRMELLGVKADLKGGTVFARPTNVTTLNGGPDGYNITGPGTMATIGDPRGLPSSGMFDGAMVNFGGDSNGNPTPANPMVGAYINNITRSIANFTGAPADAANLGSPGELLATQFVLVAAAEFVPQASGIDPNADCVPLVANPDFNAALNNFSLNDPNNVLSLPEFASFDNSHAGVVPNRTTGLVYSDGNAGNHYLAQDGSTLLYGTPLNSVNKIAYDANTDGIRDINDAPGIIDALTNPAWRNTEAISPEILFDGDGDGNFTAEDVRYWADGLAMVANPARGAGDLDSGDFPYVLDRKAGFTAIDDAFGGNFFGTSLATPKAYANGDARGDIAGNLPTRGFKPSGWDGLIDGADIDYVYANFGDWTVTSDAVFMDLSADINGDLVVDQADVCELVQDVLGTSFGDVNLDGVVDASDTSTISGNIGNPGGWADGDMDGDGQVTQNDLDIANGLVNPCVVCPADFDGSGVVDGADLAGLLAAWGMGNVGGDLNGDGNTDGADLAALLASWGACQ